MPDLISIREEMERLGKLGQLKPNEIIFYKHGKPDCIYMASTSEDLLRVIMLKEDAGCYPDHIDLANLIRRMGWE